MGKKNDKKPSKLSQDLKTMDRIAEQEVASATVAPDMTIRYWSDPLTLKNAKKKTSLPIDGDNPLFGDFVSDDDSFKPEAHFVRSSHSGQFGAFVGDGDDVVISLGHWTGDDSIQFGDEFVMTDKEAERVGTMLIELAASAKKARKVQEAHRESLPTKKSK